MTMLSLIVLMMWTIFGTVSAFIASKRGRDPLAWFAIGMALQLIGVVILFLLPSLAPSDEVQSRDEDPLDFHFQDPADPFRNKEWFYVNADLQRHGPLTFENLQKAWSDGNMSSQTFVWSEGMQNWKKVMDLRGFEEAVSALTFVDIEG